MQLQEMEYDLSLEGNNEYNDSDQEQNEWKITRVIAADDQILNIQVLKNYFADLDLIKTVQYAFNGQQAIDLFKAAFLSGLSPQATLGGVYKPVNLLILDFQMPNKNGIQVV